MKIAFIGGRTFNHPDGIATFMYNLATELVKLGHEAIVYQESDHNGEELVNGFKVVHQKSSNSAAFNKMGLGVKSTLDAVRKEKGVDLIHYNCTGPAFFASSIARLCGKKVVLELHGLEFQRTKFSRLGRAIVKFLFDFPCFTHRNITVCSTEQHDYIMQKFGKESRVITGAVNLPGEPQESDVLKRFGISPNNYVVYMGRLVQDKNPDFLIKGFMASDYKDKQLVICGCAAPGSPYEEHLHQLAKDCPNVIFTGAIFGADKDVVLRNAWAYCLPSTLEGLPISLLEGMSYGKVCIASDIQANKEALGDSGIWVRKENAEDITNAFNDLYANFDKYIWQGKANQERVAKEFSWKKKTEEYIEFISEL